MGPIRADDFSIEYIYLLVQDVTEIVAYEKKLKNMIIVDNLTGIYNRRFLDFCIKEELEKHKRYSKPLSLIMFDIDHFKNVNDEFGHQCGDNVLKSITSIVSKTLRSADILARYGGEEFCCLLPETNLQSGIVVAQRLREAISGQETICADFSIKVTASLGVSSVDEDIDSPQKLLDGADKALYAAKRQGRNKVMPPE
ncbi:MAG: GGDEF domain-containing protein [Nitrospirae bacterium]|nr:GGDEF domain-containing protein [Nitrospirota bacterium]